MEDGARERYSDKERQRDRERGIERERECVCAKREGLEPQPEGDERGV